MNNPYKTLYEKLSRLQWLLGRHRMMNHAEHGPFADTSRGQGRVLAMLKIQPEISTKDLSYLLGIRVPSLNELLNKLEKGGYIERKPSEADKRVMIIHLTEKGKTTEQAEGDYTGIFGCLNGEELSTFEQYLDRIIAALEEQVGGEPDEEEMDRWMRGARSRMGHEQFEQMMSMRGGPHRQHGRGFGGFGPDRRGPAPENMPGAERFDPQFDGPMPEGRGGFGGRDPYRPPFDGPCENDDA